MSMADAEIARIVHRVVQQAFGLEQRQIRSRLRAAKDPTESNTRSHSRLRAAE